MIFIAHRLRSPRASNLRVAARIAAVFSVTLILGGCGISDWIHGGASNLEPPAELRDFPAAYRVEKVWRTDIGGGADVKYIKRSPYVDDNVLFVSEPKGRVRAYNAASGKDLWKVQLKDTEIEGGTGFGHGMVLLGTKNGEVIALNAASGVREWSSQVSSEILAPPSVGSGIVVVQTVDGKIFGLATATGDRLWMQEHSVPALTLRGTSTPVIVSDVVLTGLANGNVVAYRLSDGKQLWEVPVSEPRGRSAIERLTDVDAPPLVVGSTLYAAAYHGKLVAFNLQAGRILWARDISVYSGMAADANIIYVSDENGYVTALDLATGTRVWQQKGLHGRWLSAPAVIGNTVAVGDFEGYVHWLSTDDGRFVARYRVGSDAILGAPVAGTETLYVGDQGGEVAALQLHPKK